MDGRPGRRSDFLFGALRPLNENGKDLSYSGSLTANRSINKSLGGNLAWDPFDRLHLELDGASFDRGIETE